MTDAQMKRYLRGAARGAVLLAEDARVAGDKEQARFWVAQHVKAHEQAHALSKREKKP